MKGPCGKAMKCIGEMALVSLGEMIHEGTSSGTTFQGIRHLAILYVPKCWYINMDRELSTGITVVIHNTLIP